MTTTITPEASKQAAIRELMFALNVALITWGHDDSTMRAALISARRGILSAQLDMNRDVVLDSDIEPNTNTTIKEPTMKTIYRVSTPMNIRDYPTFEDAKAAVLRGCPPLKRGWTTEWVDYAGGVLFRVLNSKGTLQTGANIVFHEVPA